MIIVDIFYQHIICEILYLLKIVKSFIYRFIDLLIHGEIKQPEQIKPTKQSHRSTACGQYI